MNMKRGLRKALNKPERSQTRESAKNARKGIERAIILEVTGLTKEELDNL
jgi:hypothetical protein